MRNRQITGYIKWVQEVQATLPEIKDGKCGDGAVRRGRHKATSCLFLNPLRTGLFRAFKNILLFFSLTKLYDVLFFVFCQISSSFYCFIGTILIFFLFVLQFKKINMVLMKKRFFVWFFVLFFFFFGGGDFFYFIKLNLTSFVPLGAANGMTEAAPLGQTF